MRIMSAPDLVQKMGMLSDRRKVAFMSERNFGYRISFAEGNGGGLPALGQDTEAIYEVTQPPFILANVC
jgi:hypothetical protein